jgi:hypothetical protein
MEKQRKKENGTISIIACGGMKKSVVNEFQCFLFFKAGELKSVEIRCKCRSFMDGTA